MTAIDFSRTDMRQAFSESFEALSESEQTAIAEDYTLARLEENGCAPAEYRGRIGYGNLESYARVQAGAISTKLRRNALRDLGVQA